MQSGIRVATPPPKPLMVYDGDCNFCTLWIRRWQQLTGDQGGLSARAGPSHSSAIS